MGRAAEDDRPLPASASPAPTPPASEAQSAAKLSLPSPPALTANAQSAMIAPPGTVSMGQATISQNDIDVLIERNLAMPVVGVDPKNLQDTFDQARSEGRLHDAIDILAARGTPVVAVDDGVLQKLFTSKRGGLTVYQFDSQGIYCYYYAHLDRYADGLKEGMLLRRGDPIGFVGTTGDAPINTPHLHFAITKLGPEKHWWEGPAINPYPVLARRR